MSFETSALSYKNYLVYSTQIYSTICILETKEKCIFSRFFFFFSAKK